MNPDDLPALQKLVNSLSEATEQLLLTGLTTASDATQQRLALSMKEAARLRLLRLASTIRVAGEEIRRFDVDAKKFSPQRLSFFLNRTWILCRAISRAIEQNDSEALGKILATPATNPVGELKLVLLGVVKRVSPGVFNAFEFRMIALEDSGGVPRGTQVVWSCVFPSKAGMELPAEAFLQLPQKQGFKPSAMLGKKVILVRGGNVAVDAGGVARLSLDEKSKLEIGNEYTDWLGLVRWDRKASAERVNGARVTPVDLDIEMQELVALTDWTMEIPDTDVEDEAYVEWVVSADNLKFSVRTDAGEAGEALRAALQQAAKTKKARPMLVGLMHYESCRFILQPLSLMNVEGPEYLTLTHKQVSSAELVKALQLK